MESLDVSKLQTIVAEMFSMFQHVSTDGCHAHELLDSIILLYIVLPGVDAMIEICQT